MKYVVVFPKGSLSARDRRALSEAEYVAVEADDPSKVVVMLPGLPKISADELLLCALTAMQSEFSDSIKGKMVAELYRRLKAKEEAAAIVALPRGSEGQAEASAC